ncbi:MAG: GntR family transcriptional regulator [Pseudomonadota bacterium]
MSSPQTLFSQRARDGLSKASPAPLYHQLYVLLRGMILDGTLPKGERMPTEEQLADTFDVSRITAKRAMDELAAENLVERRRGKGTHVTYQYRQKPVKAPLTGMLQEIESMARNTKASVIECGMLQPPREVRVELDLEPGDTALHLVRVRERDGTRFGYYKSWTTGVDKPNRPTIFEKTPRLSYFREKGLEVTHVTQTITAVAASREAASALDVEEGTPLLSLTRRSFNKEGNSEQLRDYMQVLYNPEHFQYQMDLELD